jgi:hypothetical protein
MSYFDAVSVLVACWVVGWVLGFKFRQLKDALTAS